MIFSFATVFRGGPEVLFYGLQLLGERCDLYFQFHVFVPAGLEFLVQVQHFGFENPQIGVEVLMVA